MAQSVGIDRTTGAAAIAIAFSGGGGVAGRPWCLEQIRVHLDIAGGAVEDLTVTIDGGVVAAVYDTLLLTQAMAAVTDIVWTPDAPIHLEGRDYIDIAYNNANTRTYGVEIVYHPEA